MFNTIQYIILFVNNYVTKNNIIQRGLQFSHVCIILSFKIKNHHAVSHMMIHKNSQKELPHSNIF